MSLKQLVGVSLVLFTVCMVVLFAVRMEQIFQPSSSHPSPTVISNSKAVVLTMDELARHADASSCWLLISNKIYDVTSFIAEHPGGEREILRNCGRESTRAFETQGGEGRHSESAQSMLNSYYLGVMGETLAPSK